MRKAFIQALCEEADKNDRIVLLTGDLGYNVLEAFAERFPQRFFNMGVAEANLVGVAAGLASCGFLPFVYSIATFMTMRPFEFIRNDISLQNFNVKIVGIGAGLAYTKAGPTHHAMEDIALMRMLPNMTIIAPSSPSETFFATKKMVSLQGPAYLRIERNPRVESGAKDFNIGKGMLRRFGTDVALLATGVKIETAQEVAQLLAKKNISVAVYAFPTIKPIDRQLLKEISSRFRNLCTIEEHRVSGGFGTEVGEYLLRSGTLSSRLSCFGLRNAFTPISTDYDHLLFYHKLTGKQIADQIIKHSLYEKKKKTN